MNEGVQHNTEETYQEILERVGRHIGSLRPERAVEAVVGPLGETLLDSDRQDLMPMVPKQLGEMLTRAPRGLELDLSEMVQRVGEDLELSTGQARGVIAAVFQALGRTLDPGALGTLSARIPDSVAELLIENPEPSPSPQRPSRPRPPVEQESGRSLATGQPGSTQPLSEASPGHSQSISQSDRPREARKISSGDGTPTAGEPLSTGRPGSDTPVSERGEQ